MSSAYREIFATCLVMGREIHLIDLSDLIFIARGSTHKTSNSRLRQQPCLNTLWYGNQFEICPLTIIEEAFLYKSEII